MTVSMFDVYLERMTLHRTERIMDSAQASFYAQVTNESRRRMWNGWQGMVSSINTVMIHRSAAAEGENPITWNGRRISIKGLIKQFVATWGKKAVNT